MAGGKVSEEYDGLVCRVKTIAEQSASADCSIWTVIGMMARKYLVFRISK